MDVFVYGTLTNPERARAVLDDVTYRGSAVLDGLHRVDGEYPTLAPGGSVEGRILQTEDVAALDRYEGVPRGLYVRISVPFATAGSEPLSTSADGETVETYVGDPDLLDASAEWPGEGPFTERVRAVVRSRSVVVHAADTDL